MKICVRNLSLGVTEEDLRKAFEEFGNVASVTITNGKAGRKDFIGYVEMPVDTEGQAAMAYLDGREFKGKEVSVDDDALLMNDDEDDYSEYEEDDEEDELGKPKKKLGREPEKW